MSGRLSFVSKRENGVAGSTIVFLLQSAQVSAKPSKQVTVSGKMYETESFTVELPNPYPEPVSMKVRLQQPRQCNVVRSFRLLL